MKRRGGKSGRCAGMTLVELMFAAAIGCTILGSLLLTAGFIERNHLAVDAYAAAEGNQMRISDYIALDVRRSLTVSVADDVLTLTVPDYYGNGGAMPSPGSTPSDPKVVNGLVSYSPTPVTITYYQQGASFYRTVNGVPTEIANNVADFAVTEAASGSFVTCSTTFSPFFTYNPSADAIAATSVFTSVYPRNASAQP